MEYLNLIGLVLNFMGSLIVAFSVIENPGGGHQIVKGKKVFLASLLLNRLSNFYWYSVLIIISASTENLCLKEDKE